MFQSKKFIVFILIIFVSGLPANTYGDSTSPEMQLHFINVGQGDSILIETPTGKTILIDGGPPKAGKKVVSYLKEMQVEKIDLLIATHPDIDHIGGLPHVMEAVEVDQVLDSGKIHSTKTYARYIYQIRKQGIPVKIAKRNQQLEIDPLMEIKVLNTHGKSKNNNQSSIALKITYNNIDFLLMSDIEKEQEQDLIAEQDVQAEILKVAHHGSNTSTSHGFLQEVDPLVAILTYSLENNFGHPVDRVIENLYKIDATIYSTATFGNIVITTDGEDFLVLPEKDPMINIGSAG
ncbi:MBL fold metallo-hydrolase [Virgibacillus sp. C22-A2]|uniref:MBL fold metallo-hydrolase n=1 Tax=Virgibacillus tibetensis TaxID=3042313 RepID=A0ABU6KGA6_9BACI|nr:MBL fold metallo-hydrolase [Virgibacillus sp. C22-A2]